ncbi:hypothetical protein LOD99_8762 [Oopsacas minuta]|uniref:Uncharacterized protein n=1 Tax=Oopsacas minuta TaxID=111878 RepID=A0AAV7JGQ8_9METZ|nr:hypothetical protein LOD99_8762 [Oopsacas minuta]
MELSIIAPSLAADPTNTLSPPGIIWAYAPKQKSLKSRTKRRELRYIIPLKTGITGCPTCGHPIMFPKLCANCLRVVLSCEWDYRQKHYTKDRLAIWKERWEAMKDEWIPLAIEEPKAPPVKDSS